MDIHNNDKEDKYVSGRKTREELWIFFVSKVQNEEQIQPTTFFSAGERIPLRFFYCGCPPLKVPAKLDKINLGCLDITITMYT